MKKLSHLRRDQRGASFVEYGLLAGGIGLAVTAAVVAMGDDLASIWDTLGTYMLELLGNG